MAHTPRPPDTTPTAPLPPEEMPTQPAHGEPGPYAAHRAAGERVRAVQRGLDKFTRKLQREGFAAGPVRFSFVRELEERSNGEHLLLFRRDLGTGPEALGGLVVVKRLIDPASFEHRERLREEVRLAFRLNHPAIARAHHFRVIDGRPHGIFEYVAGPTLEALATAATLRNKPLPAPFVLYVMREIADALHYAHTLRDEENGGKPLGIIHRDVNPRNIRVDSTTGVVKLTDFGAAYSKRVGREESPEALRKGDLLYSSPEYLSGDEVDARSDVFSLGLVLLESLTNKNLWSLLDDLGAGESPEPALLADYSPNIPLRDLVRIVERFTPADVESATEGLPEGQRAIIHRALKREPAERYASAEEMGRDLRAQLVALVPEYGRQEVAEDAAAAIVAGSAFREAGEPRERAVYPEGFDLPEA